jgi:hypothetical protein
MFKTTCNNCGNEYDPRDEVAEDHAEDCPIYGVLMSRGAVRDPRNMENNND